MSDHHAPLPVERKLLTPGTFVLLTLTAIGFCFAMGRFFFGLSAVTNLDHQHPWGLWIGIDVATGVALAAGGFTTSALVHIFHQERFHAVVRPALLTAMLGYTFVAIGLLVDLGRFYNIWHPLVPTMWSGHSVLFEVGICVTCYLTVLYLEFAPIVCERFQHEQRFPRLAALSSKALPALRFIMPVLIIAGVVLSCAHQSSLGNLMVLAPSKLHPLWYTPWLPALFVMSAIAVGFPMVIFESLYASWSMRIEPETDLLSNLSRFVPPFLGVYLLVKVSVLVNRGAYVHLFDGSLQSFAYLLEVVGGVVVPIVILLSAQRRKSPRWLFIAALLIVLGVALNRVNVFIIGFQPLYPVKNYVPAVGEFAVTIGLISLLIFLYRVIVTYFPVISHSGKAKTA